MAPRVLSVIAKLMVVFVNCYYNDDITNSFFLFVLDVVQLQTCLQTKPVQTKLSSKARLGRFAVRMTNGLPAPEQH